MQSAYKKFHKINFVESVCKPKISWMFKNSNWNKIAADADSLLHVRNNVPPVADRVRTGLPVGVA